MACLLLRLLTQQVLGGPGVSAALAANFANQHMRPQFPPHIQQVRYPLTKTIFNMIYFYMSYNSDGYPLFVGHGTTTAASSATATATWSATADAPDAATATNATAARDGPSCPSPGSSSGAGSSARCSRRRPANATSGSSV